MGKKKSEKVIDFPKKLFIYREWENGGSSYFMCYESEKECADVEVDRLVGVYELKQIGKVKVTISFA